MLKTTTITEVEPLAVSYANIVCTRLGISMLSNQDLFWPFSSQGAPREEKDGSCMLKLHARE